MCGKIVFEFLQCIALLLLLCADLLILPKKSVSSISTPDCFLSCGKFVHSLLLQIVMKSNLLSCYPSFHFFYALITMDVLDHQPKF